MEERNGPMGIFEGYGEYDTGPTKRVNSSDLYTYLDSILHEALPHNYEDLNPRELRESLTSALYERLTEDKDFQQTYMRDEHKRIMDQLRGWKEIVGEKEQELLVVRVSRLEEILGESK